MRPIKLFVHLVAAWAVVTLASAAYAQQYVEIQDNAFEGVNDASYIGGVFTWDANDNSNPPASQILTLLLDNGPLPGFTGNVHISITTNFVDFGVTLPERAYFTGGSFSLTFDYSPDGISVTSHELSGPISEASIEVTSASPDLSSLTGIVNFNSNLGVENLPGGNWPAPGESTGIALTFAIGADLSAYKTAAGWTNDLPGPPSVIFDTQFSIVPEERPVPEPSSLILLAAGGLMLVRRRGV